MDAPETRYAKTPDGMHIAYQVVGEHPPDIVLLPYFNCLDVMWDEPSFAYCLNRLARIGRLIMLEPRGVGGSDPVPLGALPTVEEWMDDVRVVLDAVDSASANVVVQGANGYLGIVFAGTYPSRTNALVLIDANARAVRDFDYTIGVRRDDVDAILQSLERGWGTGASAARWAPSRMDDDQFRRWHARRERVALSPASVVASQRWIYEVDVRHVIQAVRVPTLVLSERASELDARAAAQYLAEHIANARYVGFSTTDTFLYSQSPDGVLDCIEEFITGVPPSTEHDRVLATVLFTDVVNSTPTLVELGDKRWTRVLDRHDAAVIRELERYRGHRVNTTGDGVIATFDGPARAVRCARAIMDALRPLGIEIRAGLHTGEVELRGDDIGGIAVHIGQRVSALAGPGEVLVSRTVTDLVAGSGLEFEERGDHELKGVPGKWAIYAMTN